MGTPGAGNGPGVSSSQAVTLIYPGDSRRSVLLAAGVLVLPSQQHASGRLARFVRAARPLTALDGLVWPSLPTLAHWAESKCGIRGAWAPRHPDRVAVTANPVTCRAMKPRA